MEIRQTKEKDKADLKNILEECDKDFVPYITNRSNPLEYYLAEITKADISLVFIDNDKILGLISFCHHKEYGPYISWLMVRPGFRNMGIGKSLITHLVGLLKKQGVHSVRIRAYPQNTVAVDLYRSFGFCDLGYEQDAFPGGIPRIHLKLEI